MIGILNKLKSFEFDKNQNKIFGIKSAIIWGNYKEGYTSPLIYLRKPKHISQEDFDTIINNLEITIYKNENIKDIPPTSKKVSTR